MNPETAIIMLRDGECWTWPESDYGKAEIWFKNGTYFAFSIPMYGGTPRFEFASGRSELIVAEVKSWS